MIARNLIRIFSNPIRRDILVLLKGGRLSAGDIAKHFDVTGATVSYHLSQLNQFQKGGNNDEHQEG